MNFTFKYDCRKALLAVCICLVGKGKPQSMSAVALANSGKTESCIFETSSLPQT